MFQDGLLCPLTGMLMGQTIEHLAQKHGISRQDADLYALDSHLLAAAHDSSSERVPHPLLDRDECLRRDVSLEALAALPPVFEAWGQVTAGNASALSDGAAGLLLARPDQAGRAPHLARILGWTEVGLNPMDMGYGPVPAVRELLREAGLTLSDITLWELNEAFAAQVLCCQRALEIPKTRLNVAGGGISLGHPIGASGARILVTLIHLLGQRGGGLGVATLGIGGGLGQAILVEV
jgi:acetyl-CoA acetyltransferase family protein